MILIKLDRFEQAKIKKILMKTKSYVEYEERKNCQ